MKNKFVKNIPQNIAIMLILIAFTFKYLFNGLSKKEFINAIKISDSKFLFWGIILSFLYIFFEGYNTKKILKLYGYDVSIIKTAMYSFTGFFFSGLTPSATGGQPMQVFVMSKDGIKVSHSSLILMLELCCFQIVTIFLAILGFLYNKKYIFSSKGVDVWIIYTGIISNFIIFLFIFFIIFSKRFVNIVKKVSFALVDRFFKDKVKTKAKITKSLEEYRLSSLFIKKNKLMMLRVLFVEILQICSLYSISYFVYKALGYNKSSFIDVLLLQSLAFVSVSSIPLPGAIGVSEKISKFLFLLLYDKSIVNEATILTRAMNFYILFIISAVIFFVSFGHYIITSKNKVGAENGKNKNI